MLASRVGGGVRRGRAAFAGGWADVRASFSLISGSKLLGPGSVAEIAACGEIFGASARDPSAICDQSVVLHASPPRYGYLHASPPTSAGVPETA